MAKQFDNLYPQIIDFANLHLAWRKAKRGKRFRQAAATFEVDLEDNLIRLQRQLTEQSWQPGGYRSFRIRDPKLRLVSTLLKQLSFHLRLAHDLELFSPRRYEHACRQIEEIGRLLGGWIRSIR